MPRGRRAASGCPENAAATHAKNFEEAQREQVSKFAAWANEHVQASSSLSWLDDEFCRLCMEGSLVRHYCYLLGRCEDLQKENSKLQAGMACLERNFQERGTQHEITIQEVREKLKCTRDSSNEAQRALSVSQQKIKEMEIEFAHYIGVHNDKANAYKEAYDNVMVLERIRCQKLEELETQVNEKEEEIREVIELEKIQCLQVQALEAQLQEKNQEIRELKSASRNYTTMGASVDVPEHLSIPSFREKLCTAWSHKDGALFMECMDFINHLSACE
jgi:DNA repair exonuclease SbcCD ATPase subunit